MRHRQRGIITTKTLKHRVTLCNGTVTDYPLPYSEFYREGEAESMTDVVTPAFSKISANGGIVCSPMSKSRTSIACSPGSIQAQRTGQCSGTTVQSRLYDLYWYQGMTVPAKPILMGESPVDSLVSEAITAALANAKQPDIEGLVETAEAGKTLAGLANQAERFREALFRIRSSQGYINWIRKEIDVTTGRRDDRRDLQLAQKRLTERAKQGGELARYISEKWLEYRYLFTPIYLTAKSIYDSWDPPPPPERETFRGYKTYDESSSTTSSSPAGSGWVYSTLHFNVHRTVSVRAGTLTELVRASPIQKNRFGGGADDILSAGWELIPFSFVVDWFANVGELFRAVSPMVGRRELCRWVTVESKAETTYYETYTSGATLPSGYTLSGAGASGSVLTIDTRRYTDPAVNFALRRGSSSVITSIKRLADTAAFATLVSRGFGMEALDVVKIDTSSLKSLPTRGVH